MNQENKRRRIGDKEDLTATIATLGDGSHATFNNDMFDAVGGNALFTAGGVGGTFVGATGDLAFSATAEASGQAVNAVTEAASAAAAAKKKVDKPTPEKKVDIEILQGRLEEKSATSSGARGPRRSHWRKLSRTRPLRVARARTGIVWRKRTLCQA